MPAIQAWPCTSERLKELEVSVLRISEWHMVVLCCRSKQNLFYTYITLLAGEIMARTSVLDAGPRGTLPRQQWRQMWLA